MATDRMIGRTVAGGAGIVYRAERDGRSVAVATLEVVPDQVQVVVDGLEPIVGRKGPDVGGGDSGSGAARAPRSARSASCPSTSRPASGRP